MKTDGKNLIFTSISIFFLAKTGPGLENAGSKMEPEYVGVRKQSNTVGNSTETDGSRELKPKYRTSFFLRDKRRIILNHS
jgi:hypothetical protein